MSRAMTSVTSVTSVMSITSLRPCCFPRPPSDCGPRAGGCPKPLQWARGSTRKTHGTTGLPVSRAHSARTPHTASSPVATVSRQTKNTSPASTSTKRASQRNRPSIREEMPVFKIEGFSSLSPAGSCRHVDPGSLCPTTSKFRRLLGGLPGKLPGKKRQTL